MLAIIKAEQRRSKFRSAYFKILSYFRPRSVLAGSIAITRFRVINGTTRVGKHYLKEHICIHNHSINELLLCLFPIIRVIPFNYIQY